MNGAHNAGSLPHMSSYHCSVSYRWALTLANVPAPSHRPPDKDFSPAALQKITDVLHVSLFDEVVTDILQDDRQRRTNIHHRIEKKWLGSFTLPFSTLHQRERVRDCETVL